MGLITKKDVIRNMASLEEDEAEMENEEEYVGYEGREGGLLDDEENLRSEDSE
jgi:hypothetical protein